MAQRIALVTGGARGIGLAIGRALKAQGARVAAFYSANEEAAQQCRDIDGFLALRCDVGDYDQCVAAVRAVEQQLGPIDILVNNAGITRDAGLHKMTPEAWNAVLRVNLTGAFNVTRQVIEGMRTRRFGRVINISSINGQKGQYGQTNYSAAKAGLIGFTKALALEGAKVGVTANAIAPGYIDTDMLAAVPSDIMEGIKAAIPLGRLGQPREIARCAAFLASDDASFVTGATFAVNGGQYLLG
jgi:acetoacetyl-CoA reductase